jgi:ribonuclease Z
LELARDADLLIHEATFLRKDASKAIEAKHSLPGEAAETARVAGTKELVLTHISDTHETEAEVQAESSSIFHEVQVARDDLEVKL